MIDQYCLNCNSPTEKSFDYCPGCGMHLIKGRLNMKEVLRELSDILLMWNKAFFKTSYLLIRRPIEVVDFYLQGGRRKFMTPIFFLLFAFILYEIFAAVTDQDLFFISGMKGAATGWNESEAVTPLTQNISEGVSETTTFGSLDVEAINKLNKYTKVLFILMLPVIALFSKISFKSSKFNFAEQLSINAYLLGPLILLGLITGIFSLVLSEYEDAIEYVTMIIFAFYIFYFHLKVFQNKWLSSLLRSLLYIVLSISTLALLYTILSLIITPIIS